MGCYLDMDVVVHGKAATLCALGARIVPEPTDFIVPEGTHLVCVVENPTFDAAAYCYDINEFRRFKYGVTDRAVTWLVVPVAVVQQLTGESYYRLYTDA